jgi:hypothetical protein
MTGIKRLLRLINDIRMVGVMGRLTMLAFDLTGDVPPVCTPKLRRHKTVSLSPRLRPTCNIELFLVSISLSHSIPHGGGATTAGVARWTLDETRKININAFSSITQGGACDMDELRRRWIWVSSESEVHAPKDVSRYLPYLEQFFASDY